MKHAPLTYLWILALFVGIQVAYFHYDIDPLLLAVPMFMLVARYLSAFNIWGMAREISNAEKHIKDKIESFADPYKQLISIVCGAGMIWLIANGYTIILFYVAMGTLAILQILVWATMLADTIKSKKG